MHTKAEKAVVHRFPTTLSTESVNKPEGRLIYVTAKRSERGSEPAQVTPAKAALPSALVIEANPVKGPVGNDVASIERELTVALSLRGTQPSGR